MPRLPSGQSGVGYFDDTEFNGSDGTPVPLVAEMVKV
jgi:hypothetical protein